MDKTNVCMHFFIKGKVQGVWYRASTKEKAQQLNINGWVRNMYDGSVECFACGKPEDVAALESWLRDGPPGAEVSAVDNKPASLQHFVDFEIK